MKTLDTDIGGRNPQFPTTAWGQVTRPGSEDRERILRSLIARYWKPVYCRIRHGWARSNEDAKDLTQEFFMTVLLEGSLLEKFSPQKGSFRAFLKAALTNFMRNDLRDAQRQKRGGDVHLVSLGEIEPELLEGAPGADPDEVFKSAWKKVVWARVLELLRERLPEPAYEAFRRYFLAPPEETPTYDAVGKSLGISSDTVKNHLTKARRELLTAATEVLSDYVDRPEDLAAEMRELFGA